VLQYEQADKPCVVCVLITDDEGIRDYNYEYRGIDKPTDVLSFPMQKFWQSGWSGIRNVEGDKSTGDIPLGDIIFSVETVKRHAIEYDKTIEHETIYMLIHSTLHLLGYDHDDESNERIMHEVTKRIMKNLMYNQTFLSSGEGY